MTSDQVPDYVEPLDAFRFWRLSHDGYITSVLQDANRPWLPDEPSHCRNEKPDNNNHNGFHAYKHPDYMMSAIESTLGIMWNVGLVFGSVKLWGQIVEHELGYRSECAMVDELYGILLPSPAYIDNGMSSERRLRVRLTFEQTVEQLERNRYKLRPVDTPKHLKELRPGLYKWNETFPHKTWNSHPPNQVVKGVNHDAPGKAQHGHR